MLKQVKSKLVLKNLKSKRVMVFGHIPIKPFATIDVFTADPALSESDVIDNLKPPSGDLYKKINHQRVVDLIECKLYGLSNTEVSTENLDAYGEPGMDKFLSTDEEGQLTWTYVDAESKMNVASPLYKEDGELKIQKASPTSNGFLSKDDWLLFKGKSTGFRIWQYQNFESPRNVLKITQFENGTDFPFNPGYIVDGSAIIVQAKDLESRPSTKGKIASLFSKGEEVKVEQHVGDQVMLNNEPGVKCRVYFLVALPASVEIPQDYEQPPRIVRRERIEYIDAIDMDYGGSKTVRGNKTFEDKIEIKKTLKVDGKVEIDNELDTKSIKVSEEPALYHTLMSNAVGDGKWSASPIVSSHPPPNAYAGQLWVKVPEYEMFVWDGERLKWLSTSSSVEISGGLNTTTASNVYVKGYDNVSMDVNASVLPFDATLVYLSASGEVKQHWKAEVHADGELVGDAILHIVNNDRAYVDRLNVDFDAGSKVQLFVSGDRISMPKVKAIFRRRLG